MFMIRTIAVLVLLLLPTQINGEEKGPDASFSRDVNLTQGNGFADTFRITLDLGEVDLNKTYSISLTIKNVDDVPFKFESVRVGCACLKATVPNDLVLPGEQLTATFQFTTASQFRANTMSEMLRVSQAGEGKPLAVSLKYSPVNCVGFPGQMHMLELSTRSKEMPTLFVPVLFSKPYTADMLRLGFSGKVRDVIEGAELIKRSDKWGYLLTFKKGLGGRLSVAGRLTLTTTKGDAKAESAIYVRSLARISITPSVSHLSLNDELEIKAFVLIESRLPIPKNAKHTEKDVPTPRIISCEIGRSKVKTNCKRLGGRIYRVEMDFSQAQQELRDHPKGQIKWVIGHLGDRCEVTTRYFFSKQ